MIKLIKLLMVVPLLAFIFACGPKLTEGEVAGKEFHPAHTQIILMPLTTTIGKTTLTRVVPIPFYYPDSYSVDIKKFDGKKWIMATWWVDQYTYEQVVVGGYFQRNASSLEEQPRKRD